MAEDEATSARHLTTADYRTTPWRNGNGRTTEIAVSPEGASIEDDFDWRISVADVTADGPFSSFPGHQRSLSLLRGGGLHLDCGEEGDIELREPFKPVVFSGDWQITCSLLGAAVRDLNLIHKRDKIAGRVGFLTIEGVPLQSESDADTLVLYLAEGDPAEIAWDKGSERQILREGEALILSGSSGHALNMVSEGETGELAFIEISPKG